jgi:hypothetical protein
VEVDILETQKQNLAMLVKAEVFALAYQYYGTQTKILLLQKRLERLSSVDNYLQKLFWYPQLNVRRRILLRIKST